MKNAKKFIRKLASTSIASSIIIGTGATAYAAPIIERHEPIIQTDDRSNQAIQSSNEPQILEITLAYKTDTEEAKDLNGEEDVELYVDPEDLEIDEELIESEHEHDDEHGHGDHDHDHEVEEEFTPAHFEDHVLEILNIVREKHQLSPLTMDESMRYVARLKSKDMRDKNYFSHTSPTYGAPTTMLKIHGIDYRLASENIAMGQRTPEEVVIDWMQNAGHRANILDPNFKKIGIGFEEHGHYWTQFFVG